MLEKTRAHIERNKKLYLVGAGSAAVGSAITAIVVVTRMGGIPLEISQTAKNQALIVWKPEIHQIALVKKACPDPIPVLDKLTGRPYESIRQAMKATGESLYAITKDARGAQLRWEELPDTVFAEAA